MKKILIFFIMVFVVIGLASARQSKAEELASKLKGRILLHVESKGEAWYINPKDSKRYYMANGAAAYTIMRTLGVGVTNKNLAKIKSDKTYAKTQQGKILLQVESKGEAYYIDINGVAHYLKDGPAAYGVMRQLGLGIKTADLTKITAFAKNGASDTLAEPAGNVSEKSVGLTPVATIASSSCVVTQDGGNKSFSRYAPKGYYYFKYYGVTSSGTMTGPVGTSFMFRTSPTIASLLDPEQFTCGSWEKSPYTHSCKRLTSSAETETWTYYASGVSGEYLNKSVQVTIKATAGKNYSQLYEDPNYTKNMTLQCPMSN